jgi:hypothetical protein
VTMGRRKRVYCDESERDSGEKIGSYGGQMEAED